MTEKQPYQLFVVAPAWVGDVVMMQSLFKVLRRKHPSCQIDVLAPAWSKALLDRMPEVRAHLSSPFEHGDFKPQARRAYGLGLRDKHYDQAIVLKNSFKAALIPYFANIPLRTGWRGEMRYGLINDLRVLDPSKYPAMTQRFMALGMKKSAPVISMKETSLYPRLQVKPEDVQAALDSVGLDRPTKPVLSLCPGAAHGEVKRWPKEYYAVVAEEALKKGFDVWLFGVKSEAHLGEYIHAHCKGQAKNFVGITSMAQAVDLLSLSTAVVANDSGLMHVSCAHQLPVVAIYGATPMTFAPPLSTQVKPLSLHLSCMPCGARVCPLGHFDCMKKLHPSMVLAALGELLPDHFSSSVPVGVKENTSAV